MDNTTQSPLEFTEAKAEEIVKNAIMSGEVIHSSVISPTINEVIGWASSLYCLAGSPLFDLDMVGIYRTTMVGGENIPLCVYQISKSKLQEWIDKYTASEPATWGTHGLAQTMIARLKAYGRLDGWETNLSTFTTEQLTIVINGRLLAFRRSGELFEVIEYKNNEWDCLFGVSVKLFKETITQHVSYISHPSFAGVDQLKDFAIRYMHSHPETFSRLGEDGSVELPSPYQQYQVTHDSATNAFLISKIITKIAADDFVIPAAIG